MLIRARRTTAAAIAVLALSAALLAGCSSSERTSTSPAATSPGPGSTTPSTAGTTGTTTPPSIRDADLSGMPVPASWCTGLAGVIDGTVTLVDGTAGATDPGPGNAAPGPAFKLDGEPVYGDVDGDGVEDAVVLLTCFHWNSDSAQTHVAVLSIRDGRPTVVATIDDAGVQHVAQDGTTPVTYARASNPRLEGDLLAVDWATEELPATTTTVRYLMMGQTPTVANDTGPQYPPT